MTAQDRTRLLYRHKAIKLAACGKSCAFIGVECTCTIVSFPDSRNEIETILVTEHWLTSTWFSPFSALRTNEVTKGICIQVQRCCKPTHDHAASL